MENAKNETWIQQRFISHGFMFPKPTPSVVGVSYLVVALAELASKKRAHPPPSQRTPEAREQEVERQVPRQTPRKEAPWDYGAALIQAPRGSE